MEVELHPSTTHEIRDTLVGKLSHVRLKNEQNNRHGQGAAVNTGHKRTRVNVSHPSSCFRGQREHTKGDSASLVLTVDSVEVYAESVDESHEHASNNDLGEEPSLHKPPTAVEGHTYSYSISMSQVLRVVQQGANVIIFFQPDTARRENGVFGRAARFACEFPSVQEAADFLSSLEKVLEQFARAMLHISRGYALPEDDFQILSVSHGPASEARDPWKAQANSNVAEAVVARAPKWNTQIATPASWTPDQPRTSAWGHIDTAVWVYMSTPLGPGLAQITQEAVTRSIKEDGGQLSVNVALCQHYLPEKRSHTVHRSCSNAELAEGARSPADSVSSVPGSGPSRMGSKDETAKTVHLHCQVSTADNAPADDSAANKSAQIECSESESNEGAYSDARSQEVLSECKVASSAARKEEDVQAEEDKAQKVLRHKGPVLLGAVAVLLLLPASWLLLSRILGQSVAATMILVISIGLLAVGAVLYKKGSVQESVPSAVQAAGEAVVAIGERNKSQTLVIKLLKAEVVDRGRAGRAQSLSILQRRHSMALPDGKVNIESDSGSLDSPVGFGKDVVTRFMVGYGNDKAAARRAMQRTYDWRKTTGTFHILDQPQPHFDIFKGFFDHGVVGMTSSGRCVWVIKAGMMREGWQKFKATGLTDRDVARHIAFCHDFLYKVLDTQPMPEGGRTIWINDLKGVGIRDIGSKAMDFGLQMMGLLEKHYPERMGRALVVNAPSFFNILWRIVQPLIPASTKKRLVVLRSKEDVHKALLEHMDDADIPSEYGGKSEKHLYETEPERALRRHVEGVKGNQMSPTRSWRLSSEDLGS